MSTTIITRQRIANHVNQLADQHPPLSLDAVDRAIHRPEYVRERFGGVIDYLARVELEVERNVLELLILLPDIDETNRRFHDIWHQQETRHGLILDRLQQDLGRQPAELNLTLSPTVNILGHLASLRPIQDVTTLLYYLTGASTEKQAVLAYNSLHGGLSDMGELAIAKTVIAPIRRQEPGHFAFYSLSATKMIQDGALKPWQLFLARLLRQHSYHLAGTNGSKTRTSELGNLLVELGTDRDLIQFAREIGRLEGHLLWAGSQGMSVPPYILKALRDCLDARLPAR